MIEILIGAALATASDTPPPAPPRQFDLACEGTTQTIAGPPASPTWAVRLTVDLDAGLWCDRADDCATTRKINHAAEGVVELIDWDTATDSEQVLFSSGSGEFTWHYDYNSEATYFANGRCTIQPFTPIPASARETDQRWTLTKLPAIQRQ
jgi:hypothetical protein